MKKTLLATGMLVAFAVPAIAADPIKLKRRAHSAGPRTCSPPASRKCRSPRAATRLREPVQATSPHYGYGADGPLMPQAGAVPESGRADRGDQDRAGQEHLPRARRRARARTRATTTARTSCSRATRTARSTTTAWRMASSPASTSTPTSTHRVTLMATHDVDGKPLPLIDGSAWDPFAKVLLLTSEDGTNGGVWVATRRLPVQGRQTSRPSLGSASYEGVQIDSDGKHLAGRGHRRQRRQP